MIKYQRCPKCQLSAMHFSGTLRPKKMEGQVIKVFTCTRCGYRKGVYARERG